MTTTFGVTLDVNEDGQIVLHMTANDGFSPETKHDKVILRPASLKIAEAIAARQGYTLSRVIEP